MPEISALTGRPRGNKTLPKDPKTQTTERSSFTVSPPGTPKANRIIIFFQSNVRDACRWWKGKVFKPPWTAVSRAGDGNLRPVRSFPNVPRLCGGRHSARAAWERVTSSGGHSRVAFPRATRDYERGNWDAGEWGRDGNISTPENVSSKHWSLGEVVKFTSISAT